ncbi:MAG: alpha-hydroxy-acid oxidizing protein, partial [Hyphomicrobiaceae bacterium]
MPPPVNISDLRALARRRLPRVVFDFIDGGAQDESTLAANCQDMTALTLRPRVLVNVANRKLDVQIFGQEFAFPLLASPIGLTGLASPNGELDTARAADAARIG